MICCRFGNRVFFGPLLTHMLQSVDNVTGMYVLVRDIILEFCILKVNLVRAYSRVHCTFYSFIVEGESKYFISTRYLSSTCIVVRQTLRFDSVEHKCATWT